MIDADDLMDLAHLTLDIVDIASDWLSYKLKKDPKSAGTETEEQPVQTTVQDPWEHQESPPWENRE